MLVSKVGRGGVRDCMVSNRYSNHIKTRYLLPFKTYTVGPSCGNFKDKTYIMLKSVAVILVNGHFFQIFRSDPRAMGRFFDVVWCKVRFQTKKREISYSIVSILGVSHK